MAIFLPGTAEESDVMLDELTPREIVAELDKYVVGQHEAKRGKSATSDATPLNEQQTEPQSQLRLLYSNVEVAYARDCLAKSSGAD